MNCDFDLLSLYLEHGLTLPRRVRLEEHLRTCSTCRRELRELRRVDQVLSSWGAVRSPVPAPVENRVARSVRRRRRLKPLFALSRVMPAAVGTTAAALLVLVSVNIGLLYSAPGPGAVNTASAAVSPAIAKQSAALIRARRTSAIFGGELQQGQPLNEHRNFVLAVE